MQSNYNDDEDLEHAALLMLLAKVAHLAGDKELCLKNKNNPNYRTNRSNEDSSEIRWHHRVAAVALL